VDYFTFTEAEQNSSEELIRRAGNREAVTHDEAA
jgi:hypothetical protein